MSTYSINIGQPTESTKYPMVTIGTSSDVNYIMGTLFDNEDKLVSPRYIRDAVLSTWASSAFKQTVASASLITYVGVDSGDPSNNDIKEKIYLGKRDYLTNDIMSSSLLSDTNTDIFLFNTKSDYVSNITTRISILSGTGVGSFNNSPYIQSQVVTLTSTMSSFSLDVVNPSGGDINLNSIYGTVSIGSGGTGSIIFPTIAETSGSASNDRVLKYYNGDLIWDDIVFSSTASIGTTSSVTAIFGTPVTVNGYPIEFTDSRPVPVTFNDITSGTTFSSYPIVEILRRMIYPYLAPICSISIDSPYSTGIVEVGTSPVVKLTYSITKRSNSTLTTPLSNMIPSSHPSITSTNHVTVIGSASGVVITPITSTPTVFGIVVSDGTQSNTATASIKGIYPYFYGFSSLSTMTTAGLGTLNKLVEPQGDKTVYINGSGRIYFIYPDSYPVLTSILDNYNNNVISSFTYSTQVLSSPTGLWASKPYRVYKTTSTVGPLGPPSVGYQFIY